MLKIKYLYPNYELAKKALLNYNHDTERLDEALSWFRISSNAIYPYFYKQELYFLRITPKEEKDINNLKGELSFINYLRLHGYNCLELVLTINNLELIEVDDYYVCSFKKVPGKQLENLNLDQNIMFKYGETLGILHELSSNMPEIKGKWDYKDIIKYIKHTFKENIVSEEMNQHLIILENELNKILITKENYGLIHYDYEQDNVFYDDDTDQCYVIDFDDSIYFFYYFDVYKALADIDDLDNQTAFLNGYKTKRRITIEEQHMGRLLEKFWQLYSYARILHALSETGEGDEVWKIKLMAYLGKRLNELEVRITNNE